jgi:hypothetical protein
MPPQWWATCDQKDFLNTMVADYLKAQKEQLLTSFWAWLYEGWFQKFPELPHVIPGKDMDSLSDKETKMLGIAIRGRQKVK